MDDPRRPVDDGSGYQPPEVEDLPVADGPSVVAAGADGGGTVGDAGPEWRPGPGESGG